MQKGYKKREKNYITKIVEGSENFNDQINSLNGFTEVRNVHHLTQVCLSQHD